jgi:hypothetical protein
LCCLQLDAAALNMPRRREEWASVDNGMTSGKTSRASEDKIVIFTVVIRLSDIA